MKSIEETPISKPLRLADLPPPLPIAERAPSTIKELLMQVAWDLKSDGVELRYRNKRMVTLSVTASDFQTDETFATKLVSDIRLVDAKLREVCTILDDKGKLPSPQIDGDRFVVTWNINLKP